MRREYSPRSLMMMHESGSAAGKVTSDRAVDGSLNCASDHSLLKYLGRSFLTKPAAGEEEEGVRAPFEDGVGIGDAVGALEDALGVSGILNTCTVPLSLVTPSKFFFGENASEYTRARSEPRRNSCTSDAVCVSKIRMSVPFSLAVANNEPSALNPKHANAVSCAAMNFVVPKSNNSTRTCPLFNPGHAITVRSVVGDIAHNPRSFAAVSICCSIFKSEKLYTKILCAKATTTLSRRKRTPRTGTLNPSSADASSLMIVPYHHLIRRELRFVAASNQR